MSSPFEKSIILIDGSYGEGGGQILRTSLTLSCMLGRPIEVINIRRARRKPGLQPQHLTAVKAAATISRAHVKGADLSSTALRFTPGIIAGGDYFFDISEEKGSAGSTSLVLQTILLPLCFARHPSTVTVIGGTHVPWSPSFHYLKNVFLPMLAFIGVRPDLDIEKWGWYPIGGGKVIARITPVKEFKPVVICDRGKPVRVTGTSAISNLPRDIGVRQRDRALKMLSQRGIDADIDIVCAPSPGKGTLVFILLELENISAGFDALGAIGKRAEEVADEACRALFEYKDTDGALDPHLADQIIPYAAFGNGVSEFTTSRVTQHLLTNIWAVKQFLDINIQVDGKEGDVGKIRVQGYGARGKALSQYEGDATRQSRKEDG
ncbi:MAG TPA: RNA 3'-terminal phosphate cyclase [Nitrospirota bacterium]|nr:RNA 3'-terminal phosphate cyclase [Nitrospirota bacterium]